MNEAIGQVLPLAVGVSLSPIPIIGITLMLATPGGRSKGIAFLLGWTVGLAAAGTLVLVVSGGIGSSDHGESAEWVGYLKLGLGVLLLVAAFRRWSGRPRADGDQAMPKWMQGIDRFRFPQSIGLGLLLSAVNPKNLVLTVVAATAISGTGIDSGQQAIALAVFVLIGLIGPAIPLGIYMGLGDRSEHPLDRLRKWMARNNSVIMAVICLIIGAKLIGDGLSVIG